MWISVVVAVVVLLIGAGAIYWLLKSMGESGIEAAAPGSCRSGRCGVTAPTRPGGECAASSTIVALDDTLVKEIRRKDALSPTQTL